MITTKGKAAFVSLITALSLPNTVQAESDVTVSFGPAPVNMAGKEGETHSIGADLVNMTIDGMDDINIITGRYAIKNKSANSAIQQAFFLGTIDSEAIESGYMGGWKFSLSSGQQDGLATVLNLGLDLSQYDMEMASMTMYNGSVGVGLQYGISAGAFSLVPWALIGGYYSSYSMEIDTIECIDTYCYDSTLYDDGSNNGMTTSMGFDILFNNFSLGAMYQNLGDNSSMTNLSFTLNF